MKGAAGNDRLIGGTSGDVDFTLTDTQLIGLGTDQMSGFEGAALTGGNGDNTIDASGFSGNATLMDGTRRQPPLQSRGGVAVA